jgi:hypothetical protein
MAMAARVLSPHAAKWGKVILQVRFTDVVGKDHNARTYTISMRGADIGIREYYHPDTNG